jgi:hypothetical protein
VPIIVLVSAQRRALNGRSSRDDYYRQVSAR